MNIIERGGKMDWTLILTAIGTVATVISTIIAVRAKNEVKKILN